MLLQSTKLPYRPLLTGLITPDSVQADPQLLGLHLCDAIEIRGDLFAQSEIIPLCQKVCERVQKLGRNHYPILLTLRLQRDGGQWPDNAAAARVALWMAAASLGESQGCDYIDIEFENLGDVPASLRATLEKAKIGILVSTHDFVGPFDTQRIMEQFKVMDQFAPAGVKFALTCKSKAEVDSLLDFAFEVGQKFSLAGVFAMQTLGQVTRMLSPFSGCPLTYGYFESSSVIAPAPGQLSVARLRRALDQWQVLYGGRIQRMTPADIEMAENILSAIQTESEALGKRGSRK